MRRKIEKYLAKKQNCDESNIRYTDDGRFDFLGDLEGVLEAVRGKDKTSRSRKNTPGSSSTKGKRNDMNNSFLSVSTSSPVSSASTGKKNRKRGFDYNYMEDRRRALFSSKKAYSSSRYNNDNDNKETPYDRSYSRDRPFDYTHRKPDGFRMRYDNERALSSSYPAYNIQRRGANQGPYTEVIQKGTTNLFTLSPSRRPENRDQSRRGANERNLAAASSFDQESELISPKSRINAIPSSDSRSRFSSRDVPYPELEMKHKKNSRMETPESRARWNKNLNTLQSDSSWHSPHKGGNTSTQGLTPLSTKRSWYDTPMADASMGEAFHRIFSPDAIDSNDRTPYSLESASQNLFSPSWNSKNKESDRSSSKPAATAHERPRICVSKLRIGDDNDSIKPKDGLPDSNLHDVAISPISLGSLGRGVSSGRRSSSRRYLHDKDGNKNHTVTSIGSDLRLQSIHKDENQEKEKTIVSFTSPSPSMNITTLSESVKQSHRNLNVTKEGKESEGIDPTPVTTDSKESTMESVLNVSSPPKLDMGSLMSPAGTGARPSPYSSGGMLSGLPTPTGASDGWAKDLDLFGPVDMYSPKLRSGGSKGKSSSLSPGPGCDNYIESLISDTNSSPKRRRVKEDYLKRTQPTSSLKT